MLLQNKLMKSGTNGGQADEKVVQRVFLLSRRACHGDITCCWSSVDGATVGE